MGAGASSTGDIAPSDMLRAAGAGQYAHIIADKGLSSVDAIALAGDVSKLAEVGITDHVDRMRIAGLVQERDAPEVLPSLKALPDALDNAVFAHGKWPLVIDPEGQARRFLQYQRGSVLFISSADDMSAESLRRHVVGGLRYGGFLVFAFEEVVGVELFDFFKDGAFPAAIMAPAEAMKQEFWEPLLSKEAGDPEPIAFQPRDEFRLVVLTKSAVLPPATASLMHVMQVGGGGAGEEGAEGDEGGGDAVAMAFGVKEIKRNSEDLVEEAFEGELAKVQAFVEQGFYVDSVDSRNHSAVSEAACQGHDELVAWLVEQGADPNLVNDEGRSPLFRAAYNGHKSTCVLLLKLGADPDLRTKNELETAFDVAKDDETRNLIETWDREVVVKLKAERNAFLQRKLEERITTQAEREMVQRERVRDELMGFIVNKMDDADGLRDRLQELAQQAERDGARPLGTAATRDSRGCALLSVAVQHNAKRCARLLLTHADECDKDDPFINTAMGEESMEAKVFRSNVNSRDGKGWTPTCIAVFHDHKEMLELLLEFKADPYIRNSYHKNAFELARPELDEKNTYLMEQGKKVESVMKDHTQVLNVLLEWESKKDPAAAAKRQKGESAKGQLVGEAEADPSQGSATMLAAEVVKSGIKGPSKKGGAGKKPVAKGGVKGGAKGKGAKKGGGGAIGSAAAKAAAAAKAKKK